MGHIYENHGRFSVEGGRESFYIHADYGLKPLERRLGDVELGHGFKTIIDEDRFWVVGHMIGGYTLVRPLPHNSDAGPLQFNSDLIVKPVDKNGEPIDHMEDEHPLGRIWRKHPHPEIEIVDLDDLIVALEDYRSKIKRES